MDKFAVFIFCVIGCVCGIAAAPKMRVIPQQEKKPLITSNLPANWTLIRDEIADTFSCDGKTYGYYADVDNDCQVFHVCLPIAGRNLTYKWSFICPGETIFNQESFTCTRLEDSIKCDEAPNFYNLNDNFGQIDDGREEEKESAAPESSEPRSGRSDFPVNKRKSRLG